MRTMTDAFKARLNSHHVCLARVWQITRTDGEHLYFTDHDEDIKIGDVTYSAKTGFVPSSILRASGSKSQGMTITTYMEGGASPIGFSEPDVRAGYYDGSPATVSLVHWDAPELGAFVLFTGKIGETTLTNEGALTVDIDPSDAGQKITLERYSMNCRADFGDARCKYPIEPLKREFTVTSAEDDRQTFVADGTANAMENYWQFGTLVFDSGQNAGVALEVMLSDPDGTLVLFLQTPFPISVGDTGRVWPGCDKQFLSGCVRWDNRANFRGEPGYQVVQPAPEPTPIPDDPDDHDTGAGHWQGYYSAPQPLPGHGFFWGKQFWHWSGAGTAPGNPPTEQGAYCNSTGGGGFPACQGVEVAYPSTSDPYGGPGGGTGIGGVILPGP